MEEFFTRDKANEGVKFPLFTPQGKETEHWIQVIGIDSDRYKQVLAEYNRKAVELSELKSVEEKAQLILQIERELVSKLVVAWSFEKPCTFDNVVSFLKEAPQIENMVNKVSANRSAFYSQKPLPSASGLNPN